jgi:hypothetical protein
MHLTTVSFHSIEAVFQYSGAEELGNLQWDLAPPAAMWLESDGQIRVGMPFEISISTKRDAPREELPVGTFRITVRLSYGIAPNQDRPTPEDISHYVGVCGFLHAWPYVRAELQSLTTKLGLPALVLPTVMSQVPASKVTVTFTEADAPLARAGKKALPRRPRSKKLAET